jgi:NAD(P)H-dependent FMN reductase
MSKLRLAIVIGSIRPNRFGGHAAQWIEEVARRRGDFEVELIDLKDYPMPLFAEEASPLYAPSKDEVAGRWQKSRRIRLLYLHGCRIQFADRPRF